jgi:Helix-turn-helix domain
VNFSVSTILSSAENAARCFVKHTWKRTITGKYRQRKGNSVLSVKQMSRVWEKAATDDPSTLLVLLALADWANDDGVCWPAIDSIAEKCRVSPRTAQRIVKELEECDLLEVTRKRGRTHTNTYRLKVPTCQVLFDVKGANVTPLNNEKVTNETEKVTPEVIKGDTAMSPEPLEPPKPEPSKPKKVNFKKFQPPGWVPIRDWEDWLEVRKKKRIPETDRALQLSVDRLAKFQNRGHPPGTVLQLAIERGWTGLFEPTEKTNGKREQVTTEQHKVETKTAVAAGVDKFLRGKNGMGSEHVPVATAAKSGNTS